jgi:hypothetical protein
MHDLAHWFDVSRHFIAYTFEPYNWSPNVSAGLVVGSVTLILWPKIREKISEWFGKQVTKHVSPLVHNLHTHIENATGVQRPEGSVRGGN